MVAQETDNRILSAFLLGRVCLLMVTVWASFLGSWKAINAAPAEV